jgi:hypothetical protein
VKSVTTQLPHSSSPPPVNRTNHTAATMGHSWKTPDQKLFIEGYIPLYVQHLAGGTLKTKFWPNFFKEWFEAWPLPEPTPEVIEEKGSVERASQSSRSSKVGVSTIHLLMTRLKLTVLRSN